MDQMPRIRSKDGEASQREGSDLAGQAHVRSRAPESRFQAYRASPMAGGPAAIQKVLDAARQLSLTPLSASQADLVSVIITQSQVLAPDQQPCAEPELSADISTNPVSVEQKPFQVRRCIRNIIERLSIGRQDREVEIRAVYGKDVPWTVIGDLPKVEQILMHYFSTAIAFTRTGLVISQVDAGFTSASQCMLQISVQTCSNRAEEEALQSVWFESGNAEEIFQQGLKKCDQYARAMGGRAWIDQLSGLGPEFHLTLDIEASAQCPEQDDEQISASTSLEGKSVLIIDPAIMDRKHLASVAGMMKMKVQQTSCPAEALAWVNAGRPFDIAVMSSDMPASSIAVFAKGIRDADASRYMGTDKRPVSLIFASGPERRLHGEAVPPGRSFCSHISKPYELQEIKQSFTVALSQATVVEGSSAVSGSDAAHQSLAFTRSINLPESSPVLLMEPCPVKQEVARLKLQAIGQSVQAVASEDELFHALNSGTYRLVVIDLEKLRRHPAALVAEIRQTISASSIGSASLSTANTTARISGQAGNKIRIVALARRGSRFKALQSAADVGLDGVLEKPLSSKALQLLLL